MVICLERGVDLHTAQLMPLPLTVSCFSEIQTGFTFLVPAHLGSPGHRAIKRVCVCVCVIEKLIPSRYSARVWITDGYRAVRIGFQHYIMSQYLKQSDYQIATVPFPLLIFLFKCNISSFVFVFLFS